MTAPELDADTIVRLLGLEPHPEGGYFHETFRDSHVDGSGRAASTAIYFLLKQGQLSRWHRVDAAETWHWYAGAPLLLSMAPSGRKAIIHRLGPDLIAGERPQAVVPGGHWQQAASTGAFSLVGCTVAPGFTFDRFEMAPMDFQPGVA